jgi:hypothetical protein
VSNISVDYDVLNQRGSPAWFTDTFANIPTAGFVGRMFISKDTFAFYRDTGTGWDLIGGPGIGTLTGSGVVGQVSFFNGTQVITGSNNLFWDNTNARLGIGTATPSAPLDIHAVGTNATFNGTGTSNASLVFQNAGASKWTIGNIYNAGANSFAIYNNGLTSSAISISSTTNIATFSASVVNDDGLKIKFGSASNLTASYLTISAYGTTGPNNTILRLGTTASTLSELIFSQTSSYAYTFPATTGTLALTSDLSSYVPYTGATTNVNLGANNFTAGGFIQTGTNTSAQGGGLCMAIGNGTNNYGGQGNAISIYAPANSQLFFVYGNGTSNKLVCLNGNPTDGNQSYYNWPSALSGTLALTSDLSAYLPLAGGTLTGALGGTSAIFSSNLAVFCTPYNTTQYSLEVNGGLLVKNTGRTASLTIINADPGAGGNDGFVQVLAGGTFTAAYSTIQTYYGASNVSGSLQLQPLGGNVLIGTTTNATYKLDIAGNLRNTTSAYFATTSGDLLIGTTTSNGFKFKVSNNGAEEVAINPGDSANVNNYVNYNRSTLAYIQANYLASKHAFTSGNVLINTTTDSGQKLQVNGTTQSNGFQSYKGSITLTAGNIGTIYTMTTDGIYFVYCRLNGGSAIYQATAIVSSLATNTESFISITRSGANVALSVSGNAIRLTSGAFSTQTWQYSILYQNVD